MRKFLIFFLALLLTGCTKPAETIPKAPVPTTQETIYPAAEASAMAQSPEPAVPVVLEAEASGIAVAQCEDAVIDYSHTDQGYVMVKYLSETPNRLKVLVQGPSTRYSYNLTPGNWEVFPLSDGNGDYQIGIYIQVTGKKYAAVLTENMAVSLEDEFAPFLRPNQYVNYSEATAAVALAQELNWGLTDPLEKVAAVYDYVISGFTYDAHRAATVQSGYLPDLDSILAEKKGICFDYAALMTAMLRSQEIPCKLVVGYAGSLYHAWISVWTEESGWIDGIVFFDGHLWHRMDPTFAASADKDEAILEFIQNGDYSVKYLY